MSPPDRPPQTGVSQATLEHVVGELTMGVVVADQQGTLRYANRSAVRLLGGGDDPARLVGQRLPFDASDLDGRPLAFAARPIGRAVRGQRFHELDCVFHGWDGVERRVRCAGGPVELAGGEPGGWVSFRDVSHEEQILAELRDERDLNAALVQHSPLAISVMRAPDMVYELVNPVFAGLRPDVDMLGRPGLEVFPEAAEAGFFDLAAQVAESGETVAVTDTPIDFLGPTRRFFSFTFSRLPQPLGTPTRVLLMARETTEEVTSRSHAETIAAERTQDLARARITSARLRSLVELSAAMASVEDLESLLYLVTGETTRLLGGDTASLFLLDDRGGVLVGRAAVGMPEDELVGLRFPLPEWPEVAAVLRTGTPAVHVRAEEVTGPEQPYVRRYGIRSYLAVRLGTPGRPLGIMFVNHTRSHHRFTRDELAFAETLSSYLSVTIERAQLVAGLREAVTSLQAAMLPTSFPVVPGLEVAALYRSASEVAQIGGDFYDLFPVGDGRVAAVIGDVCGKGTAAASHTARLRFELRAVLEASQTPGRALAAFNERVLEEFVEEEFVTLAVLLLDPATGAATWSSAGHPPPVMTGERPRLLAFDGSLPIALLPGSTYRTARFRLPVGRCLVLYTDGVIEARSPEGDELGVDGLTVALPAEADSAAAVAEVVLKEVLRHTGGHLDDDAAVLVLRRPP